MEQVDSARRKEREEKAPFCFFFPFYSSKGWEGNCPSRTFNEILLVVLYLAISTKYTESIYETIVSIQFTQHSQNVKIKDDRGRKHISASTLGVGKWM